MNLEQKLEAVQNQLNEIKSELEANKRKQEDLKKRNWPQDIEPGMVFDFEACGDYHIVARIGMADDNESGLRLIRLKNGNRFSDRSLFGGSEKEFTYIGLAEKHVKVADDERADR